RLLRARRERPRCRAAEQRDELAAVHSITSSARASSVAGTSRPSALAVLRLIASSTVVGCSTGYIAGLGPLQNLDELAGQLPEQLSKPRPIADQRALFRIFGPLMHGGQPQRGGALVDVAAPIIEDGGRQHVEGLRTEALGFINRRPDLLRPPDGIDREFDSARSRRVLQGVYGLRRGGIDVGERGHAAGRRQEFHQDFLALAV